MTSPTLPEIAEADARGSVAETYAEIRIALAVEMVVLYYRVLAAEPGRVERVWGALGPNLRTVAGRAVASGLKPHGLDPACPLDGEVLRAADLDPAAVASTVEAFDRANRLNLVALTALLHGTAGNPRANAELAEALRPLPSLPLPDLTTLSAPARALLERMSAPLAGPERPILVPSMLRVFARQEAALEALWRSIGPAVESPGFAVAVDDLVEQARAAAKALPHAVPRETDPQTRAVTARFVRTIPGMIVVCDLVRRALVRCPPGSGTN